MLAVSNPSPLSNLAVIGKMALLQQIYPQIFIPPAAYDERMRLPEIQTIIASSVTTGWLEFRLQQTFN